jgi:hypothetical protein
LWRSAALGWQSIPQVLEVFDHGNVLKADKTSGQVRPFQIPLMHAQIRHAEGERDSKISAKKELSEFVIHRKTFIT